jgi:hypothetical protein
LQVLARLVTWNTLGRTFGIAKLGMHQTQVDTFVLEVSVSAVNAAWPVSTLAGIAATTLPLLSGLLALTSCYLAAEAALHYLRYTSRYDSVRKAFSLTGLLDNFQVHAAWSASKVTPATDMRSRLQQNVGTN